MKLYAIIVSVLMLASCAATRYMPSTNSADRDSTYLSAQRLDSLFRATFQRDSTYQRDSIYVYVKGDTVTKYVEKVKYKWQIQRDTIYRDRLITDTVYMEKRDSTVIIQPVEVEKPIKWYNQGFIWLGRLCLIALIIWAIVLYLKRKL